MGLTLGELGHLHMHLAELVVPYRPRAPRFLPRRLTISPSSHPVVARTQTDDIGRFCYTAATSSETLSVLSQVRSGS